jgi:arylsulfatase A-like enzyme
MIQEQLQEEDYKTAAFVGGGLVSEKWGFDRGFDLFVEDEWHQNGELSDEGVEFIQAREYLNNPDVKKPFFVFVHTYFVHQYWFDYVDTTELRKKLALATTQSEKREIYEQMRDINKKAEKEVSQQERNELYGRFVRECDDMLMDFITSIDLENTIIIITSDHGQGLGEVYDDKPLFNHTKPPYPCMIHIPLVIFGIGTGTSEKLVGTDDMPGLIARLAERRLSIMPVVDERQEVVSEFIADRRQSDMRHVSFMTADGKQRMIKFRDSIKDGATTAIPDEMKTKLQALGYLD